MKMNPMKSHIQMKLLLLTTIFLCVCFHPILCIVGRDLVLTPRLGLQLTGKSIYYESDSNEVQRNHTVHPWERTLKHVTFVTLFTEAAASAVAGNISKLKEYKDFLESPYISKENANPIRFGDIVMLANGRLEQTGNHTSFRFIEGTCGYDCQPERVWALWQVQKIRHRSDQNRNFRYEMKFSISPLRTEAQLNELRDPVSKEELQQQSGDMYVRRDALKTYIQREDDYPHSFGRIIYPEEIAFAQKRRHDENFVGRNFRQVNNANDYRQVTPMTPLAQPTFMHGLFHPHPHSHPHAGLPPPPPMLPQHPKHLNLGEYVKGGFMHHPHATPKIELFPNAYSAMHRNHHNFPVQVTTFRPNYDVKLPRPQIYQPTHQSETFIRFPSEHSSELKFVGGVSGNNKLNGPPLVAHHYHHHFFMPASSEINLINSAENHINSNSNSDNYDEHQHRPARFDNDNDINSQVTPLYYNNNNNNGGYDDDVTTTPRQQDNGNNIPPAPQKISFPIVNFSDHIVEVTPPTLTLKKPQVYPVYPANYGGKIPILVYTEESKATTTASRTATATTTKPFIQSEPIEDTIRYSEPDPLYINAGKSVTQVESPYLNPETTTHDNIEAQTENTKKDDDESSQEEHFKRNSDQIPSHSQRNAKITSDTVVTSLTNNETTTTTIPQVSTTTATSTTTNPNISPPRHGTTPIPSTTETPSKIFTKKNTQIISTSTTESPLRSVSRIRTNGRTSTTTADPKIVKWKPGGKRRNQHSHVVRYNSKHNRSNNEDSKVNKNKVRKSDTVVTTQNPNNSHNVTATTSPNPLENSKKVLEVLTQKSVSRSISVKVGSDGEEIPFPSNDVADNEVKRG